MDNMIFHIRNLKCKYPTSQWPVLEIDELDIHRGEVVFFVGSSGVGKSTILETLGLMNNTIDYATDCVFQFSTGDEKSNLNQLWEQGENALAVFRRKHLSFIFQSTNLFNNLTAFENICLSQIVRGKGKERAELDGKRMLKTMFDAKAFLEIIQGKKVTKLSGGQRQRLAFVRAIVTDYSVLLADEPTGNLDWWNANNLLKQLIDNVKKTKKTAIVVTHDINLALEYGDRVVLIRKKREDSNEERVYGIIDAESVYSNTNEGWHNSIKGKFDKNNLAEFLKTQLSHNGY